MTVKDYRLKHNLTVRELTEILKREVDSRLTLSTVSYMENGVVEPSESIRCWLAKRSIEDEEEGFTGRERLVLNALMYASRERPLTRSELRTYTKLKDRDNREIIEGLRAKGAWIINGPDGKGYYITEDGSELEEWLKIYSSRAYRVLKNRTAMLSSEPMQVRMEE